MNFYKPLNQMRKSIMLLSVALLTATPICAQEILTLGKALQFAETGSPDLQCSADIAYRWNPFAYQ